MGVVAKGGYIPQKPSTGGPPDKLLKPFKKGGFVKTSGNIYAHKGEFILPKGVKPTTKQIAIVRKRGGAFCKK